MVWLVGRLLDVTRSATKTRQRIFGIDFTSAPRKAKPIVCCEAELTGHHLQVRELHFWTSFDPFELFLGSMGPWFAGLDFPFGQPAEFVSDVGWLSDWNSYVAQAGQLSKQEFVDVLLAYSASKPAGQKHLFRETDRDRSACSPMMVYGVPVAKMFYEGAHRLLKSNVAVLPCRPNGDDRSVIEAYPALLARRIAGRVSYKSGSANADSESKSSARKQLTSELTKTVKSDFGLDVDVPRSIAMVASDDFTGDQIDAIFCCIQAAWASMQAGCGIPASVRADEGWIVSPAN